MAEDRLSEMLDSERSDVAILPFWVWTERNPTIKGEFVEEREITTTYGPMEGAVISIEEEVLCKDGSNGDTRMADEGDRVIVWRKNASMHKSWAAPEPGGQPPEVGERVGIKYIGEQRSTKYGNDYPLFRVAVDRPSEDKVKVSAPRTVKGDEDLPF